MRQSDERSETNEGNLTVAYAGGAKGWQGCFDKDCLPDCNLRKNHCERLKLFLEQGKPQ